jgi:two-component system LytT family response regulator
MTAPITVVIADDEELARRGIRARLARVPGWQVAAECGDGRSTVETLKAERPDVVFLDVQMPGLDGFEVLEQLAAELRPVVVFLTAHDEHALRAFDEEALDYLLKPVDDDRFASALKRVARRVEERRRGVTASPRGAVRIAARDRGRVVLVDVEQLDWIEADGDHVRLHARDGQYLVRETLASVQRRLPPSHFVRIHRSTIVNAQRVREVIPHVNREAVVVLTDGTRLKLSRGYRENVKALLP